MSALLLDRLFGEPKYHPLVLFGHAAQLIEGKLNRGNSRLNGLIALLAVTLIPVVIIYFISYWLEPYWFSWVFDIAVLALVIGWQSMKEHAMAVFIPLKNDNLEVARKKLSLIVSRDTEDMQTQTMTSSVIESLLENANDCLFSSLFWYAVLGPAGAVLHRLVNTLDAMWGYKNERYLQFGYAAAKLDDVLGWAPARLTGLCFTLSGSMANALKAWSRQRGKHKSPNGGLVMASGAGALGVTIAGPVSYNGILEDKIYLGVGEKATIKDIPRAITLVHKSIVIWLVGYTLLILLVINSG